MSGPFGSQQWMYSSGFYPHEIGNSARLDTNAYFQRTPSSSGSRTTWTWNAWVKLGSIGQTEVLFTARTAGQSAHGQIYFEASKLAWDEYSGSSNTLRRHTTQLFRDPSAWYMVTIVADTTNATASNRGRVYINGTQVTEFSVNVDPTQNQVLETNQNITHRIGANTNDAQYFNGYIAEVNFIDGQALDPSYFGETKADTWIPKKYTGSYGTNGFYLDFATRATDPIDASGQGNNWSSTNVASTDWMLDSPTNNWATFTSIGPRRLHYGVPTLTQGNLTATSTSSSDHNNSESTVFNHGSGKWYYEIRMDSLNFGNTSGYVQFNIGGAYLWRYYDNSNTLISTGGSFTSLADGDIVMIAVDQDNGKGYFGVNGGWYNVSGAPDPAAGTNPHTTFTSLAQIGVIEIRNGSAANTVTGNFGQDSSFAGQATAQGNTDANGLGDFYYEPPAGFLALCTANMPDPVAAFNPAVNNSPQDHFNTVLYTGDASAKTVSGVGFQPDFLWIKNRSSGYHHALVDSVRGATKILSSSQTISELTTTEQVKTFTSDGFTLGDNSDSNNYVNLNNDTYVAWNWKAGGSGVSNNDGSTASVVSANRVAGFSIVTYTGTGSAGMTIGHGLSSAPALIIVKNRDDATENWTVYSSSLGNTKKLELNLTTASATTGNWNNTSPSSSVFTLGSVDATNSSGDSFVAYCFHNVEGFSKFGTYTGNGSTDGPFINTGFRPAFVIVKKTNSTGLWIMTDNKRQGYNVNDEALFAEDFSATSSGAQNDFTANGFKLRSTSASANANSDTYLYMAFAEMPFKYANAR